MKAHFKRGIRVELPVKVEPWMKPNLEGLVKHPLYSTWAMVYHMETAARMLLAPYLEENEEAVGGAVLVKHLQPAAIHANLKVCARLVSCRDNKVTTRLEVYDKSRKIGEGSHVQVVMSKSRFVRLLRDARSRGKHGQG